MENYRRVFLLIIPFLLTILIILSALPSKIYTAYAGSAIVRAEIQRADQSGRFDRPMNVSAGLAIGDITITKETIPECAGDGDLVWDFKLSGVGYQNSFALCSCCTKRFNNRPAGTYLVTEIPPAGWETDKVLCSGGITRPIPNGVEIDLADGDEITCTFTSMASVPAADEVVYLPVVIR